MRPVTELEYFKNERLKMEKNELKEYLNKDIESLRSLNFSETYIKSVIENTTKWAGTRLLDGIQDPYIGRSVAALMENQRLFNEQWPPKSVQLVPDGAQLDIPITDWAAQWRRVSIPVMRRAFSESFIGYQIVSVQVMKNSQENTYLTGFDGRQQTFMTDANTRPLGVSFVGKPQQENFNLQEEADYTAAFAQAVQNDFGREIIRDLAQNAGKSSIFEFKGDSHLMSLIEGMSAYIGAKCFNREATWIITSPAIVRILGEFIETDLNLNDTRSGINWIGTLNKNWKLFEDSTAPDGNILLGLKDFRNHYFSGYVFAPFLPVNPTPAWKLGEQESHGQVLARYGKRLANPNFYGTLKIENLPQITPLEEAAPEEKSVESEE